MRNKLFFNKFMAYACAGALAISSMAGYTTYSANAAEGIEENLEEEDSDAILTLDDEGSPFIKEFVGTNDGYDYLGYVYDMGATSDHKWLAISYVGDITGIRLDFDGNVVWFNQDQANHFVTVDGSEIELVATEETYAIIDLEASGIDMGAIEGFHIHGEGMVTNGGFEIIDAELIKVEELDEDAYLTLDDEGSPFIKEFVGTNDGYDYLGYVYDMGATSAHKWMELTYVGNLTGIRLDFDGNVIWFNQDQANHFVTDDESEIELVVDEPTTIWIDLEASGVDMGVIEGFHIHGEGMVTNGGFEIIDAVLIKDDSAEEEPTDSEELPTEEEPTFEVETGAADDIVLNGTDSGSSMVGSYKVSSSKNQYKYLGFATLKDPTAEYKYLVITYTGDITSIRFEFAMVTDGNETAKSNAYWFNPEGQTNYFVTADESPIPLDGGTGTTIVIDLEKTGISLADYNSVHMHAGYGKMEDESDCPAITFAITNARLSKTEGVKDTDKETVTQTPTVQPETTTRVQPTTKAPEVTTTVAEVKKPAKVKFKKVYSKKKASKNIKIKIKKVTGAAGYQVQVSKSKSFKKKNILMNTKSFKNTTKTFKSKKFKNKKKIYVRVRAYVLDAKGNKVTGKWSKAKAVKISK